MASSDMPKYAQIKSDLRLQIMQGEYTPGQPFVTQQQICDIYGVSMLTAARALKELEFEGLVTRVRGRGTFVAETTPSVPSDSVRKIVCIVPGLTSGHVSNFVRGLETQCVDNGYDLMLADSHGSAERQSNALARAATSQVAGVVIYPVDGAGDIADVSKLRNAGIPIVFADRYWPEFPADAVVMDDFAIGYELTRTLIERGHSRILTLWVEVSCTSVRDRLAGHTRALQEAGLPVLGELTALRPYQPPAAGKGPSVLRAAFAGASRPTAILCANGFVLASALNELAELDIAPGAVDLAGMDEAGPYDALPLTVVSAALPSFEMGRRAGEMVFLRIDDPASLASKERITLSVEIHENALRAGA